MVFRCGRLRNGVAGCKTLQEFGFAEAFGPGLEAGQEGGAFFGAKLLGGSGQVAAEVGAAGGGDPGAVAQVEAFGGERKHIAEHALFITKPRTDAVAEFVAVVAEAVATDEFGLVDEAAKGGKLGEHGPVAEAFHVGRVAAGALERLAADGKGREAGFGAVALLE